MVLLLPSVLCLPRCSLSLRPGSRGGLQTRASRHKPAGAGCPLGPETGSKRLLLSQLSLETTCPRALRRRRPSGAGRPLPGARGRRPPARPAPGRRSGRGRGRSPFNRCRPLAAQSPPAMGERRGRAAPQEGAGPERVRPGRRGPAAGVPGAQPLPPGGRGGGTHPAAGTRCRGGRAGVSGGRPRSPAPLRRCRTSGLAGVCPAGALPEPPAPAGRRGLLYRRAAGGRLLLPPGRAGPPPGSAGLARSGRGGFAPARPGGLLTRLRGGALGSPERARGCPRVLVPLGPSGRRDCGEHRKRACGEQIRSAGIRAPVPGRPRRPWVAWRRTRAAQGPAGVWARRAVPAWGREGRACPPCPEPPRGGGPGRRRVVLASQPLWTRGACPREASELRSGFSPVRPCQARLRCARVKGLCGRGTRVVLPNLRVSVVIEFPKTGVCGVKYKPKKPLNVSLCEQRRAVPAMKRSPLWPARGKL